ncbi:aminopeptidase N [Flexivirga meconopsidis]|uniref:aminopeptidase N n=1 Tax=Flexivirga meconopsidis TaxID=2977121 RepID=UPI00223EAB9A|nr:aminopeptidase N [Flexivirga meconopsidis]
MATLLRTEAVERAALLTVTSYDLELDFTRGDEVFGSPVTIRFACAEPGAGTFAEFMPGQIASMALNGRPIDASAARDGRLRLDALQADNELVVEATMRYVRDGEGMHRAVDPEDGQVYLYGSPAASAAGKIYACFDQPDLKAPYSLTVTAPSDWVVTANAPLAEHDGDVWRFAPTRPIATYFFTVCAGPFVSVSDEHDGIPLGLYARATLGEQLREQADEMFAVTKEAFDYYHRVYAIGYPWGKYDQVFVPEFNMGAMENPGCVTFRDEFVFQGEASYSQHLLRATVIAHEMAHMWFGDLVTMRWWDDLWLNESFAEFVAHQQRSRATNLTEAWLDFSVIRKNWGYAADRAPSTHPIAGMPAPDVHSALLNLDGITYPKGASALRQLEAYLGEDAFRQGVRNYLEQHSFGNATLQDFLDAMQASSGVDLHRWTQAWLLTPGTDVFSMDGSDTVVRTTPAEFPADRPHLLDVVGYRDGQVVVNETVRVERDRTKLPSYDIEPKLLLPNATDTAWGIVELDPATQARIAEQLPLIPDATARAVIWSSLTNGLALGTVNPRLLLDTFARTWWLEPEDAIMSGVGAAVAQLLPSRYLPPEETPDCLDLLANTGLRALTEGPAPASTKLTAARLVARTSQDVDLLRRWLAGDGLPPALDSDEDFRWLLVHRLAEIGSMPEEEIAEHAARDESSRGVLAALGARTAIPTGPAKQRAWQQLIGNATLSNREAQTILTSFFSSLDQELTEPYVERFFTELPLLADRFGDMVMRQLVTSGYPLTHTDDRTLELAETALTADLPSGMRRAMVDSTNVLREQLASRRKFR